MRPAFVATLLAACAHAPALPPVAARTALPPSLRLPGGVRPTRVAVELTLLPAAETFDGIADLDIELALPTDRVWLNATALTISSAVFTVGGTALAARVLAGGEQFAGFETERPIGPGPAHLRIVYRGRISSDDFEAGLSRGRDGDEWYIASQFEAIQARRAIPCFDEPDQKTPFRLTLHVLRKHLALSNAPVVAEHDEPGGMKRVEFAETRPLPSYLWALAVGPWDLVDAGNAGRSDTKVRIAVPRGRAAEARFAASSTPKLLALVEDYFGAPYPFEKLDLVAVPQFPGIYAMENPGLITFSASTMLATPANETLALRRDFALVCAHELAHQWFGNLVTMAWWDDLWLNEGFADWLAFKIVARWQPASDAWPDRLSARGTAFFSDSTGAARRIHQPIRSEEDILTAFDSITYAKSASVVGMFERWIGEEPFRRAVQRHLAAHAYGNATTADFLGALSAEAGRDVAPSLNTFLDQGGVPEVTVALRCPAGAPPVIALQQDRYLPLGAVAKEGEAPRRWGIPLCVKWEAGKASGRECLLLDGSAAEVVLAAAPSCPDFVLPADGEERYFHVRYAGDLAARLLAHRDRLTPTERAGLIGDLEAAVRAGGLPLGDALALWPALAGDPDGHVALASLGLPWWVGDHLVTSALRPNYQRLLVRLYGARAATLGWRPRKSDDDASRLLRPPLLALLADEAEDPALRGEAAALARSWLDDPKTLDFEVAPRVLMSAARHGDRDLFDRYRAGAGRADSRHRKVLLHALGAFRDRALVHEALGQVIDGKLTGSAGAGLLDATQGDQTSRRHAYDFIREHFADLVARLPQIAASMLPSLGGVHCDEAGRREVEAFFRPRAAKRMGATQVLEETLQSITQCAAIRAAQQESLESFLKRD